MAKRKEREEKREALWEVSFDHSLRKKKCEEETEKERKWKRKLEDSLLVETPPQERLPPRGAKGFTLIAASGVSGGEKKGTCNL